MFAEGALFHLGDGHAVQGCGEIVGTGVEISLDVRFTVQILKGKTIVGREANRTRTGFASATLGRLNKRCSMQRRKCWLC
ncbi:hypothetical protein [Paenibacillus sp. B1-33]|uniref:hypothetical protein n=1 Tax=unclassified Paenibacillus TaxID=185978 RepID=UPI003D26CE99